jgi:hypothetical protein
VVEPRRRSICGWSCCGEPPEKLIRAMFLAMWWRILRRIGVSPKAAESASFGLARMVDASSSFRSERSCCSSTLRPYL